MPLPWCDVVTRTPAPVPVPVPVPATHGLSVHRAKIPRHGIARSFSAARFEHDHDRPGRRAAGRGALARTRAPASSIISRLNRRVNRAHAPDPRFRLDSLVAMRMHSVRGEKVLPEAGSNPSGCSCPVQRTSLADRDRAEGVRPQRHWRIRRRPVIEIAIGVRPRRRRCIRGRVGLATAVSRSGKRTSYDDAPLRLVRGRSLEKRGKLPVGRHGGVGKLRVGGSREGVRVRAGLDDVVGGLSGSEPSWEVAVGAVAGVVPFVIAAVEFGKRIAAQRRCHVCGGSGLVLKGRYYRKCGACGGFLPWLSWKRFFSG
ncbi:hypothetical protein CBR_g30607 [Chara braunii]|uniref:Viral late gene transcription factor 3 zinc ribbon domain-containing protein n=1 Tax=Chara braunii TaxID=69332 RepID=A0A388LDF1_CHABU|nr:hypothetical protein CBR_g30607 [Chara braunii]|eukprot:GBG80242.1 hypothetical protein CBR_g30607 [Chara braunii]